MNKPEKIFKRIIKGFDIDEYHINNMDREKIKNCGIVEKFFDGTLGYGNDKYMEKEFIDALVRFGYIIYTCEIEKIE